MSRITIKQPKVYGEGDREYTIEQYVELFTWHSKQLFKVLDDKDPNFADDWQEMMEFDKKIENMAIKRFCQIHTQQNS